MQASRRKLREAENDYRVHCLYEGIPCYESQSNRFTDDLFYPLRYPSYHLMQMTPRCFERLRCLLLDYLARRRVLQGCQQGAGHTVGDLHSKEVML